MEPDTHPRHTVLIVEPDSDYCELLREALEQPAGPHATIVRDIEAALLVLQTTKASDPSLLPHLVLLDAEPQTIRKFLRHIRHDVRLSSIPVALLVSSDTPKDIRESRASGADGYVVKPDTFLQLTELMAALNRPDVLEDLLQKSHASQEEGQPR